MRTVEMAAILVPDAAESPCEEIEELGSGRPALSLLRTALLVAAGGALGSVLRWALSAAMPATVTPTLIEIPWATLIANAVGCLSLGVLAGMIEVRPDLPRWLMPFVGTGLCGGFTTMSAVVLQASSMLGAGFSVQALFYGLATAATALMGTVTGLAVGRVAAQDRVRA